MKFSILTFVATAAAVEEYSTHSNPIFCRGTDDCSNQQTVDALNSEFEEDGTISDVICAQYDWGRVFNQGESITEI